MIVPIEAKRSRGRGKLKALHTQTRRNRFFTFSAMQEEFSFHDVAERFGSRSLQTKVQRVYSCRRQCFHCSVPFQGCKDPIKHGINGDSSLHSSIIHVKATEKVSFSVCVTAQSKLKKSKLMKIMFADTNTKCDAVKNTF